MAILQAPGKLLALDSPVSLKHQLGKGFSLAIHRNASTSQTFIDGLLQELPNLTVRETPSKYYITTGANEFPKIRQLVEWLQRERGTGEELRFQVNSATLEEVFLDLNTDISDSETLLAGSQLDPDSSSSTPRDGTLQAPSEKDIEAVDADRTTSLVLTPGRKPSRLIAIPVDAFTIFRKRLIILRRSWLLPLIAIAIVISATCIPLFFMADRNQSCELIVDVDRLQTLTYPRSFLPLAYSPALVAPPTAFGNVSISFVKFKTVADNATFVNTIADPNSKSSFGGIALASDPQIESSLFAWEGSALTNKGLSILNMMGNALLDNLIPPSDATDAFKINVNYQALPSPSFLSTALAFKWIAFL